MSKAMSYKDKCELKKNILKLEEHEQYNILFILKHNNVQYSKNSSGIRFRDDLVSDEILREIKMYVDRWLDEKQKFRTIKEETQNSSS